MLNTIISRCQHYKIIYNEQKKYDIEKISTFIKGLENKKLYKRIEFLSSFISKDRNDNLLFLKSVSNYILENNISNKDVKILVKRLTLLDNVIEKLLKNANQELVYLDLARNWK